MKGQDNSVKGLIVLAVVVFLVLTSPGWREVLGVPEGSLDIGTLFISLAVLVLLGWVIKGA